MIKNKWFRWSFLSLLSILFLLFYSPSTSPLIHWFGYDSAFFILVGQGMTEGLLPYRDFFDMKGPFFFFIQYLGQIIGYGRWGIFILQWINLTLCLCITDGIYDMFTSDRHLGKLRSWFLRTMACIIPILFYAATGFEDGNTTEEFSLPWLLLATGFALYYIRIRTHAPSTEHPIIIGLYDGFAFGILSFIRITNAAMLGAIILTISIDLIVRKKIKNLLMNGLMFILGTACALTPFCIYYASQDLLSEMLSQVFLFGFEYATEVSFIQKICSLPAYFWVMFPPLIIPLLAPFLFIPRGKAYTLYRILSPLSFLFLSAVIIVGNAYQHYFAIAIPYLVLGFALMIPYFESKDLSLFGLHIKKGLVVGFALLLFIPQMPNLAVRSATNIFRIVGTSQSLSAEASIQDLVTHIPDEDRDSVFVYGLISCSRWYTYAEILPPHKYCDWQEHYIELKPEIGEELSQWIREGTPKWIVTEANSEISPQPIADAINEHYEIYAQNDQYLLYTKRPQG